MKGSLTDHRSLIIIIPKILTTSRMEVYNFFEKFDDM